MLDGIPVSEFIKGKGKLGVVLLRPHDGNMPANDDDELDDGVGRVDV